MQGLPPQALKEVAEYFQALAQPSRLQLLNLLRAGELSVGDLAQQCGFSTANVSRHLAFLMRHGLVDRQARGTSVYYRIADESVYALCDLVCGNIARQLERTLTEHQAFVQDQNLDHEKEQGHRTGAKALSLPLKNHTGRASTKPR